MGGSTSRESSRENLFGDLVTKNLGDDRVAPLRLNPDGKYSKLIGIHHRIDTENDGVWVGFTSDCFNDGSTFYSIEEGKLERFLDRKMVMKLPHDLVHMGIHPYPEGLSDDPKFSPDIHYPDNSVIEVTTTSRSAEDSVVNSVWAKYYKYIEPIGNRTWQKFNVVCVTNKSAYTLEGEMGRGTGREEMVANYQKGVQIVNEFIRETCYQSPDNIDKGISEQRALLKLMNKELLKSSFYTEVKSDCIMRMSLDSETYEKPFKTFSEWESSYEDGDKIDKSLSPFVHVPMILPVTLPKLNSLSGSKGVYNRIYDASIIIFSELSSKRRSFDELLCSSYINQGSRKSRKDFVDDTFSIRLDESEKKMLAVKGVSSKSMSDDPDVMLARMYSQKGCSFNTDTRGMMDYCERPIVKMENPVTATVMTAINHCIIINETSFPDKKKLITDMLNTDLMTSISFIDSIMREITYNARRKDTYTKGSKYTFICRPVDPCTFMILKLTSYEKGSNLFYCVYTTHNIYNDGIFEHFYPVPNTNWKRTDFLSTDRNRLSHYASITSQVLSIWLMLIEEVGDGISASTTISSALNVYRPLRMLTLILLEDKAKTSELLSLFRYYYMEIYSGYGRNVYRSQKITNKLPDIIRSKLSVGIMKELFQIHSQIPERFGMKRERPHRRVDDDEDAQFENVEEVSNEHLMTPFMFRISHPKHILLASYVSVLHNKDEDQDGHSAQQILEKTLKREYEYQKNIMNHLGNKQDFSLVDTLNPNLLKTFQASIPAINIGSNRVLDSISRENKFNRSTVHKDLEISAIKKLLETTYEELCTMKASTVPFDSSIRIEIGSRVINEIGRRKKCIHEMLRMSNDFRSRNVSLSLDRVIEKLNSSEESSLQITMFKKNQIGGVREIYVLTMRGRILMRAINDIFRSWCELHPSEKLTSERTKDGFTKSHFREAKEMEGQYRTTIKVSSDMTNWANLFSMYEFAQMTTCVGSDLLKPLILFCLEKVKDKKLQLPRKAVEMWMEGASEDKGYSTQRLKREFRAETGKLLITDHWRSTFINETNMMQGILHYVSSFYHLCHLEYLKGVTESIGRSLGIKLILSFEVSSDDEGILITISNNDVKELKSQTSRIMSLWPRIKHSCDKLFGVRTSFEKTTVSVSDLFEFNSRFYIGNTVISPIIKFVARSSDDQPEESLHMRLAGFTNSLVDLRRNGATGYLCHSISIAQCIAFMRNLGVGTANWYENGLYEKCTTFKLSHTGFFPILPACLSGLVGLEFSNWFTCKDDDDSRLLVAALSNYRLPSGDGVNENLSYGMFPRKKWKLLLDSLGLRPLSYEEDISEQEARVLLSGPRTIEESVFISRMKARDPSISKSLAVLTRSDTVASSVYFLWSSMFPIDNEVVNIMEYQRRVIRALRNEDRSYPLCNLFPHSDEFNSVLSSSMKKYIPVDRSYERRMIPKWYSPIYHVPEHQRLSSEVISTKWFGIGSNLPGSHIDHLFNRILQDIPYLRETMDETLLVESNPYKTRRQLINSLISYSDKTKPISMLSRGSSNKSINTVEGMVAENTSSHHSYQPGTPFSLEERYHNFVDLPYRVRSQLSKLEDRMSIWYTLFKFSSYSERQIIVDAIEDDMSLLMKESRELRSLSVNLERVSGSTFCHLVISRVSDSIKLLNSMTRDLRIYKWQDEEVVPWDSNNKFFFQFMRGKVCAVDITHGVINTMSSFIKEETENTFKIKTINHKVREIDMPNLHYRELSVYQGTMVQVLEDDYGEKYFIVVPKPNAKTNVVREAPLGGKKGKLVNDWFSRSIEVDSAQIDDLLDAVESKDPFTKSVSRSILRQIKNVMDKRTLINVIGKTYVKDEDVGEDLMMYAEELFDDVRIEVPASSDLERFEDMEESLNLFGVLTDMQDQINIIDDDAFNYSVDDSHVIIEDNPMLRKLISAINQSKEQRLFARVIRPILLLLDQMTDDFYLER